MKDFLRSADLDRAAIEALLDRARSIRAGKTPDLSGRIVGLMFLENSSRTRASFEMACKRMGAQTIFLGPEGSSIQKGETDLDSARILDCLGVDVLVLRTAVEGGPAVIADAIRAPVINGGEGTIDHPSQGLLDALTLLDHFGDLTGKIIAIVGDVEHSRVARSNRHILAALGATVRLVGIEGSLAQGIKDADAVMALRIQKERLPVNYIVPGGPDYHAKFGLNHESMKHARPGAVVLHPLPMNRGVEISDALADDPQRSLLWKQMENGLFVRMALLEAAIHG